MTIVCFYKVEENVTLTVSTTCHTPLVSIVDQEVSDLTQDATDSCSSPDSAGIPHHLPANVEMTAESVAAFMRNVNRIRFNSMNIVHADNREKNRFGRSRSFPSLDINEETGMEENVVTSYTSTSVCNRDIVPDFVSSDTNAEFTQITTRTVTSQTSFTKVSKSTNSEDDQVYFCPYMNMFSSVLPWLGATDMDTEKKYAKGTVV